MPGIGQLDVDGIVKNYVAAQRARVIKPLEDNKTAQENQISILGKLRNLLHTLEENFAKVKKALTSSPFLATSTDPTVVTVNAIGNELISGTYNINVTQLAQAQKFDSAFLTNKADPMNLTQTLTFTNSVDATQTFNVNIAPTDTLQDIQQNINSAADNIGVHAVIIASNDSSGNPQYTLELQADDTGLANGFTVSGDTADAFNFSETQGAANAEFTFNDYTITRSSNSIDDVVEGLSFNLLAANKPVSIIVNSNQAQQVDNTKAAVKDMLSSYNDIIEFIDASQAIPKNHNNAFDTVKDGLITAIKGTFGNDGDINSLAQLGIVTDKFKKLPNPVDPNRDYVCSGELKIAEDKYDVFGGTIFNYELENDFANVVKFFNQPDVGLIDQVSNVIDQQLIGQEFSDGTISTATAQANKLSRQLGIQINQKESELKDYELDLKLKYSKLNALLATYDQKSGFLETQFKMLSDLYRK